MAFNADEYLASLQPPTVVVDGQTHVGRILSFEEWLGYEPRLRAAMAKELGYPEVRKLIEDLCDAFFPRSRFLRRRSVAAKRILALPLKAQMDALKDFMRSQAVALGAQTPGSE